MGMEVDNHCQIIAEHSASLQPDASEGEFQSKQASYGEYESIRVIYTIQSLWLSVNSYPLGCDRSLPAL